MKSLLVTGANGQLGKFVAPIVESLPNFTVRLATREDLDLASSDSIDRYFAQNGAFDVVLNLAAYTQVDLAETDVEMAEKINALAPAMIGAHCRRMVHVSTDYVFDGEKRSPYNEVDRPHPLGEYGASKLRGEQRLLAQKPNSIIVRTSWLYSEAPGNFLTKILKLAKERPQLTIVNDQRGTPTYARDLAEVLGQIATADVRGGVYHYSNEGETTWCEFAQTFLKLAKISTPVIPIATSDYKTAARRPMYSVLDKTKIKNELGITTKPWQESVKTCLKNIF